MENKSALLTAYLSQREALRRFLSARLGDPAEAEDLIQELWLRLNRADIAEDVQNPDGYLFKMAMNLARDHRRERQRAVARDSQWVEARHVMSGAEIVADMPAADDAYAAKQQLALIRTVLDELSPQCRRVFLMHKFDGLSHADIAARTGISRSTVEKHMNTALKHLLLRLGRG